ncbi:peptidoglycan-associated lipoprotein [Gilliamella sp. Choc4-2]|uniref:peptidoglycan-associated lipoprotein Pal n=1 Tax=unclassified Gilliamella TaxID=2685620 RepID=UPI0004DD8292|nr:peptidoglycan-associated lipoprotein Pal [Gilliamella apicola]KFA59248.1 18K peptidoglycan-associated outer membrane lipoprotein [Gilliamella apicola]OCG29307.1 peptidoglycan-associated lipoprotein [Gilliamella apicola]OCG45424.1 peptidoglycan-associated lipoprotein [Gilliamella apicola]OCG55984.1 peptidoglycan-associated lipoprotein [Gilliamella apicola]OCG62642.1 peptidoglycan-associated lipoprotein [Gilliamella apicola]
MQFSKFLKVAVVALPLIAVTACSSKNTTTTSGSSYNGLSNEDYTLLKKLQQQEMNTVYFDFDKYDIKPEYRNKLDAHASFLRAHTPIKIVIEGHADERGTPEYNIALGERRAVAVESYLQANGVSVGQMTVKSYGKEQPAVLGHDEAVYAKNRRAVIVY